MVMIVPLVLLFVIVGILVMARFLAQNSLKFRAAGIQIMLALALCLIGTAQPILMELAKSRNGGKAPFDTPSMVFYTEALKAGVALVVYSWQYSSLDYTGLENLSLRSSIAYAVPALLYATLNNLNYVALQLIDPPTFQLWGCGKLAFAGVFFRLILGRELSARRWVALGFLAAGMAITTLKPSGSDTQAHAALGGISIVLCTSVISGLSGVFNEWLIKFQDPEAPLMLKNFMIYIFGVAVCIFGWRPNAPLGDPPLFFTLVVVQAAAGLCVSFVLKYCDALVKGFASSGGVLLATIASAAFFGFHLHLSFVVGFAIVVFAFYLYFVTPPGAATL